MMTRQMIGSMFVLGCALGGCAVDPAGGGNGDGKNDAVNPDRFDGQKDARSNLLVLPAASVSPEWWIAVYRCDTDKSDCTTKNGAGQTVWDYDVDKNNVVDDQVWKLEIAPNRGSLNADGLVKFDGLFTSLKTGHPYLIMRGFEDKRLDVGVMVLWPADLVGDASWNPYRDAADKTFREILTPVPALKKEAPPSPAVPGTEPELHPGSGTGNLDVCFATNPAGSPETQNWIDEFYCVSNDAAICAGTTDPRALDAQKNPIWVHTSVHGFVDFPKTIFGMRSWYHRLERRMNGEFVDAETVLIRDDQHATSSLCQ
ncbi:MAG: hypothetical protein H6Q90_993 [Deltaproteobacteria bacterium]|nr:hypothetical protein [Deltaproteobacteria bacterium]